LQPQLKQSRIIISIAFAGAILLVGLLYYFSEYMFIDASVDRTELNPETVILTSDSVRDQSWGSHAFYSQIYLEEHFNADVEIYPNLTTDMLKEFRTEKELENAADLIVGHGGEFSEVFEKYAPQYSETEFVTLHGDSSHDNHTVYTFDISDAEIQALIGGAEISKTKKIGVLSKEGDWHGYDEIKNTLENFYEDIEILYETVESRNNKEEALEALDILLEDGADVIYSRGNTFNRYVIDQARKRDFFVIGFIEDQSYLGEDCVLTSVVVDIPAIYERMMSDYLSEDGLPGDVQMLTLEDRIYGISSFGPMYTEEELYRVNEKIDILREEQR
jgi:transcriptional activator of comK gene